MGFGDASLFLKIDFVLLIVALLIQILGVALPFWISSDLIDANWGLWRYCVDDNCRKITGVTDWLEATRALEILGLLILAGALVVTALVLFVMNDNKILKLVGWLLSFVACGFIIIGIIIFGAESKSDDFSGAFAITIIAGLVALVAGVLGLLDWMGKAA